MPNHFSAKENSTFFPSSFFASNRDQLLDGLEKDSLVLIPAAKNTFRSAGLPHPFSQNPSFFYFSGITTADCLLLLIPYSPTKKNAILFIPKPSSKKEKWFGKMLTKEEASASSGIAEVEYLENFFSIFDGQQNWKTKLYIENNILRGRTSLEYFFSLLKKIKTNNPGLEIKKIDSKIALLRNKKQPLEIKAIQKSIDITKEALEKLWQKISSFHNESQLETELLYQYQLLQSEGVAFHPIIAGGNNALTLHYEKNNAELKKEELLLIDTGATWNHYHSDITRVIPLFKKFTDKQKKYYELVLEIQQRVVAEIRPSMSWWDLYQKAETISGKQLKKGGIIADEKEHKNFTIHRIGHSLGLDVHDICNQDHPLTEGTVLTVEPGLYLPQEQIGIRIEDDYLVTKQGAKNLSAKIPKQIQEIENFLK